MSDVPLTTKDYLEAATESSKRTRLITIVLVVSTVLTFVGLLNSNPKAWTIGRIQQVRTQNENYVSTKLGRAPTLKYLRDYYEPVKVENEWTLITKTRYKEIERLQSEGRLAPEHQNRNGKMSVNHSGFSASDA